MSTEEQTSVRSIFSLTGNDAQVWLASNYPIRVPLRVNWDMTNACNLGCLHCYASSGKPMPGELTDEEVQEFAHQLVGEQVVNVTLAGGEPFIRPITMTAIEILTRGSVQVSVVTNGAFITPERARHLAELGIKRAAVSVDGATATAHDSIRLREGSFASAIHALRLLRDAGVTTSMNMVLTAKNITEAPDAIELAIGLGCASVLLLRFIPVGRGREHVKVLELGDDAFQRLAERIAPRVERWRRDIKFATSDHFLLKALGIAADEGDDAVLHRGCQAGRSLAWVDARGDVYGCVFLPIPYGNVREASLREIWHRSIVRDVRTAAVQAGMECGGCAEATRNLVRFFRDRPVVPMSPRRLEATVSTDAHSPGTSAPV